jgi:signal transduction histidine kinase
MAHAEVVDDGARASAVDGGGNGLAGLRERAEQLAGRVEAGPAPDGGFRLRVTVPLHRPAT